jgi:Fe-S cluster assembly ATP-binding protein
LLRTENLSVRVKEGEEILKGIDITVKPSKVVVIMGPNGSGKSTLVNAIMGNEKYELTSGRILLDDEDITHLPTHERAKKGIFVSFQNPPEIKGVRFVTFLPMALQKFHPDDKSNIFQLRKNMVEVFKKVGLSEEFISREMNVGFSGGERKRAEMAQMLFLKPRYALLDEIDSGLDVDALRNISSAINEIKKEGTGFLIITHFARILHYVKPDEVLILKNGEIVARGDLNLALKVEERGYEVVG